MSSLFVKHRASAFWSVCGVLLVALIAGELITAQTVTNERRNSRSSYDQAPGDYYTGRAPYPRTTMATGDSEIGEEADPRESRASSQPSSGGFGPSHSRVVRDGLEYVIGSMSFPTGVRGHDGLLLEKIVPAEMMVGQSFTYEYRVTNLTSYPIHMVRVMDQASGGLNVEKADPQPVSTSGGVLVWELGKLDANGSQKIRVQGSAADEGVVSTCGWATYSPVLCEPIRIVKASLQVAKSGPSAASICDPLKYEIAVKNNGSSTLTEVQVIDDMQEGLSANGQQQVAFNVGTLEPGEVRQVTVNAQASRTGTFTNRVRVTSAQGVEGEDQVTTRISAPALQIGCEAPEVRFIGRPVEVCFNVSNPGSAPAGNTMVETIVPAGASVQGVTDGGRVVGDRIQWNLGELGAGDGKTVCARYTFATRGTFRFAGQVRAGCLEPVSTICETQVRGVPGVLLEVIDIDDPIEVGASDTYEISVTNQGTAVDSNIVIECRMEESQQFVSASGATPGAEVEPRVIRFQPLPTLNPKQTAIWRVKVKALVAEDVRFRVILTTDQISRPVEETEATNQY